MAKAHPLPDNVNLLGKTKTKHGTERNVYSVACVSCGQRRNITRHDHATRLAKHPCKKCSNKSNHPQGEVDGVRVSWFRKYMTGAKSRSLEWALDITDICGLLEIQKGKCALSGLPIQAAGDFDKITASIDRINNSEGYTPGNVQLVHKRINMMRGSLPVDEFVSLCKAVAQGEMVG